MRVVKSYIHEQINKVAAVKEWDGDSSYQDIPLNKIDNTYTITFGDINSDVNGEVTADTFNVELKLFKAKKNHSGKTTIQTCLETIVSMRGEILSHKNFNSTNISNIRALKTVVRPSSENPDIFESILNFTFEIYQSL